MGGHWFWWLLTAACVAWYSVVAIYVAFRGVLDIRQMIETLSKRGDSA